MAKDIDNLLRSTRYDPNDQPNFLGKIWRRYMQHINLGAAKFDRYMDLWLNDPANRVPARGKKRSSYRGNLTKQLTKKQLTMDNFLTGIRFTRPKSARLILEVTTEDGREYREVVPIILSEEERKKLQFAIPDDPTDDIYESAANSRQRLNQMMDDDDDDDDFNFGGGNEYY